jgi:hypothetical protein
LSLAVLGAHGVLDVLEDLGAQLDVARLVDAVHVAEGQRGHPAAVLAQAERLDGLQAVLGGGVQLGVDLGRDAVLLAADDADLDLEDDVGGLGLASSSSAISRFSPSGTAEPSHMCDWKSGRPVPWRRAPCEMSSSGRT